MVKLSRTSFGFLAFSSLVSLGFVVAAIAVFGTAFAGALVAALSAALVAAFFTTDLTATLVAGLAGAETFLAGVLATLFAADFTAGGVGTGADGAGVEGVEGRVVLLALG